jgi:hypothetical protein
MPRMMPENKMHTPSDLNLGKQLITHNVVRNRQAATQDEYILNEKLTRTPRVILNLVSNSNAATVIAMGGKKRKAHI